jgi:hypothetical protein
MKKLVLVLLIVVFVLSLAAPAFAHTAPPCNDTDGDGSPSGKEYAAHHISALAKEGNLGADGHKPGSHRGFSLCNPSGK